MLCINLPGTLKKTAESSIDENENTTVPAHDVFGFTLRSFPSLDKYRQIERPDIPYYLHSTVEKRVDALLRERSVRGHLKYIYIHFM